VVTMVRIYSVTFCKGGRAMTKGWGFQQFRLNARYFLTWLFLLLALAACSTPPPKPVITKVEAEIAVDPGANLDVKGRSSPIVVRIYELKSASSFTSADFFSLWEKEQATLGADLATREELFFKPGEKKTLVLTFQPGSTQFGVVAAYRDLEHATWRAVAPAPVGKTTHLAVAVGTRNVVVSSKN
jgi:type VI secretion system protein VasD